MGSKSVVSGLCVFIACVAVGCSVSWLGVFWLGLPGKGLAGVARRLCPCPAVVLQACDVCQQAGVCSWVFSPAVACECRQSAWHVVLAAPVACLTVAWLPLVPADVCQVESPR